MGEGIVATEYVSDKIRRPIVKSLPVNPRNHLMRLVQRGEGKRIHVGSQAGGGGSLSSDDMVVNANLSVAKVSKIIQNMRHRSQKHNHTWRLALVLDCLTRYTKSGGPNSRKLCNDSVRASTAA